MLKFRINYWNCSRLADFIRGSKKPSGLPWKEWERWHIEEAKKHPIRYWFSESGLKILQDIIYFPVDSYNTIKIYIQNRFIDKTHYIKTGLKPGQYYEIETKILHGLFTELVDFVEIELAHLSQWNTGEKYKFINGRCVEAGLDHLAWACSLVYNEDYLVSVDDKDYGKPTEQALDYRKIRKLYNWWKHERPKRVNPYTCEDFDEEDDPVEYIKQNKKKIKIIQKVEKKYDKEDTEMLIELIKLRHTLWV